LSTRNLLCQKVAVSVENCNFLFRYLFKPSTPLKMHTSISEHFYVSNYTLLAKCWTSITAGRYTLIRFRLYLRQGRCKS